MHLFLCFLIVLLGTDLSAQAYESQRLIDISNLVFRNDAMTTGRRNPPIPQMSCIGTSCDPAYMPQTMMCYNTGHDGIDVNWRCEGQLNPQYKLGTTEVNCEGFNHPDDPFILAGSCAVEYQLIRENVPHWRSPIVTQTTTTTTTTTPTTPVINQSYQTDGTLIAISIVFFLLCIWICCAICLTSDQHYQHPPPPAIYTSPPVIYTSPSVVYTPPPTRSSVTTSVTTSTSVTNPTSSAPTTSTTYATTKRR